MSTVSVRAFQPRHVQLLRALFAALAAVMITFSTDHSAVVGLSVFSGFVVATAIVLLLSAWLVYPAGERWPVLALGVIALLAGMASGIPGWRTTVGFFVIVVTWAFVSGAVEAVAGWRARRGASRPAARDGITVGLITVVLGIGLLIVSPQYSLDYTIAEAARTFTLTGITIAVGVFGGYAAILAVYLGIAGFSPERTPVPSGAGTAATS